MMKNKLKMKFESFYENILSGSLFESSKIIIINRASDKIYEIIQDLIDRNITNVKIIIKCRYFRNKIKTKIFF